MASHPQLQVRPVEESQVLQVIEFLRSGFPNLARRAPAELRCLFEYQWPNACAKPNLGFALWSGNELVGFLGTVYAERDLKGRRVKTCNLSTWYVRQEFRGGSIKLLLAVMAQKEYSITNFTASPEVRRVMEALRFQTIDHYKWVYLPWHFGRQLLNPERDLLTNSEEIEKIIRGEEREFLRDHRRCNVRHYLLQKGSDYSYMILKRRKVPGEVVFPKAPIKKMRLMWYPAMEVLYFGNSPLALNDWGRIVSAILRRERVLALVVPGRLAGDNPPIGTRLEHRNYLLPRVSLDSTIDSLYSELAVYPF